MRMRFALVLLLAVGCSGYEIPETEEDRMLDRLWSEVFHAPGRTPIVVWVTGDALDCDGGTGWVQTRQDGSTACIDGNTPVVGMVQVARPASWTLAQTALAHEYAHHALMSSGADPDDRHAGPSFAAGGSTERGETWLAEYEATRR